MNLQKTTKHTAIVFIAVLLFFSAEPARAKKTPPSGMVLIPAGEFRMGDNNGDDDEKPQNKIYLKAFYIDKNEVTNARYMEFVKATNHEKPYWWNDPQVNQPNQPVVGVSWYDAVAYAKWAGKRLPTEAEWEKAAKGILNAIYPWGKTWDNTKANSTLSKTNTLRPVGSYPAGASSYGVNDMLGNVWEWCSSWYHSHYYYNCSLKNPTGPSHGRARVIRGGSWTDLPRQLRTTNRYYSHPNVRTKAIGFRCAADVKPDTGK